MTSSRDREAAIPHSCSCRCRPDGLCGDRCLRWRRRRRIRPAQHQHDRERWRYRQQLQRHGSCHWRPGYADFSVSAGSLPPGSRSAPQASSAAPTGPAGTASFSVSASDSASQPSTDTQALTIDIVEPLAIATASLPARPSAPPTTSRSWRPAARRPMRSTSVRASYLTASRSARQAQ